MVDSLGGGGGKYTVCSSHLIASHSRPHTRAGAQLYADAKPRPFPCSGPVRFPKPSPGLPSPGLPILSGA
jgi:hypothetical protein